MIQIIKYNEYPKKNSSEEIVVANFRNYKSFDLYNLNIICLNDIDMWTNSGSKNNIVSCAGDICKLKKSIITSKSKCIIILPTNGKFKYSYNRTNHSYGYYIDLKNMLPQLSDILTDYIFDNIPYLEYEPGISTINDVKYNYDFYFESPVSNVLIRGDKNGKAVAICHNNVIITTLQVQFKADGDNELLNFLSELYKSEETPKPDWVNEYIFYDDKKYIDSNIRIDSDISKLLNQKNENNKHLDINNHFKSVLYESGDKLQSVVIEILEDIIGKHNDFDDVYEEDYLFKSNNYTFIVETKGLSGEVQGKHVTDAISHLTIYEDGIEQKGIEENTKCLFIVASERMKKISDRNKIKDRNITIANRNNTLIIDTPSLLSIYEDFLEKKIKKEEIIKIFIEQNGIINYKK